uniref:Putative secreted protein n=1 Tax=Amblyomma cajennense TaxID=34607 RepID=A0A023FBY3_AMBCJ
MKASVLFLAMVMSATYDFKIALALLGPDEVLQAFDLLLGPRPHEPEEGCFPKDGFSLSPYEEVWFNNPCEHWICLGGTGATRRVTCTSTSAPPCIMGLHDTDMPFPFCCTNIPQCAANYFLQELHRHNPEWEL